MNITYFLTDLQFFYGQEILAILISISFYFVAMTTTVKINDKEATLLRLATTIYEFPQDVRSYEVILHCDWWMNFLGAKILYIKHGCQLI